MGRDSSLRQRLVFGALRYRKAMYLATHSEPPETAAERKEIFDEAEKADKSIELAIEPCNGAVADRYACVCDANLC